MLDILLVMLGAVIVLALLALRRGLASFAAQRPADYAAAGPALDPRRHLDGPLICDGVVYGPTGRVVSRFTADMEARWDGNRGVLREHFRYDDGSSRDREWRLTLLGDGRIEARAEDVVGAGQGWFRGPALALRYRIRLPAASGGHVLGAVDWMYLTPDGTIVNRSQFRKFGVTVAELVATMRPAPAPAAGRGAEAA
ncbi:DUF3833 domain-containing protein [Marinibacterium sp. SX1]|uniref:DUF3833 domain-containing protein n=1 Tax=Marinibacterium sp. SX1 TaxID=3388424 RepID=UPI003D164A18